MGSLRTERCSGAPRIEPLDSSVPHEKARNRPVRELEVSLILTVAATFRSARAGLKASATSQEVIHGSL